MHETYTKRVAVIQRGLRAKARAAIDSQNEMVFTEKKIEAKISNERLFRFQWRHNFKFIRSHGESGDAEGNALIAALP